MNTRCLSALALALAGLLAGTAPALAQAEKRQPREIVSFGTLRTMAPEVARSQALDWLKGTGKTDAAALKAFAGIWDQADRPLLDRVADTLVLGDTEAGKLLSSARDPNGPAPTAVPEAVKDVKRPLFYRANLALAYARALSNRRVYEQALDTLRTVKPEQVVDPASFLFHRAVAQHGMVKKTEAAESIARLLDDVADAPERYKTVAALMVFDMLTWREKDLPAIARGMKNIERRLELVRGGAETQEMEKDVINRLKELIKEKENEQKNQQQSSSSCPNEGKCPGGGEPQPQDGQGTTQASKPATDSKILKGAGDGKVDGKVKNLAENWGKLPEKERAKAMLELTRDMPPKYRDVMEKYIDEISKSQPGKP